MLDLTRLAEDAFREIGLAIPLERLLRIKGEITWEERIDNERVWFSISVPFGNLETCRITAEAGVQQKHPDGSYAFEQASAIYGEDVLMR